MNFFHFFLVFSSESTFDRQVKVTIKLREMQKNSEENFFSPLFFFVFLGGELMFPHRVQVFLLRVQYFPHRKYKIPLREKKNPSQ